MAPDWVAGQRIMPHAGSIGSLTQETPRDDYSKANTVPGGLDQAAAGCDWLRLCQGNELPPS
jgi:hypothetical protein